LLALIRNGANAPAFSDARPLRFAETSLRRRHRDRVVRRGLGMMIGALQFPMQNSLANI